MTVALGFCFSDSVLVAADSQVTVGDSKLEANKVGEIVASWGQVICAHAGNMRFATSAFQRIRRARESAPMLKDPVEAMMRIVKHHYDNHVFSLPDYKENAHDYDYELFLGVRLNSQKPQLFRVQLGDFIEVGTYDCAGSGGEYARIVLRWLHSNNLSFDRAVALAAYVIGHVKVRAQYCDGPTRIKVITENEIRDVAETNRKSQELVEHMENIGNWFACECEQFVLRHAFGNTVEFAHLVELLNARALRVRHMWDLRLEALANPQSPMVLLPDPPPWPE